MPGNINLYIQSLRLDRWPRSLAFIPGFTAALLLYPRSLNHQALPKILLYALITFLLTWSISTANYIVNEITDAPFDRFHPHKKNRPLVKKMIKRRKLLLGGFILSILSFFIAAKYFSPAFVISLSALLMAGILYNVPPIRLKDIPFLDSTMESANNPIRFLIGWYAVETAFAPISLLLCWWAFGNFLMVGKRVAEKKFLDQNDSANYRLSLKRYSLKKLIAFMIVNSILFIFFYILFTFQFHFYTMLIPIPFIVFYLFMFAKKSIEDREIAEEPEKLLKNKYFAIYSLWLLIIFILAFIFK